MGKEKPVYAFIRRGNYLCPELEMDTHALDGIAQNERVKVDVKQFRSLPRLRAYWAMLHDCIEATDCAPNVNVLHDFIKLDTGHVEHVRLANGFTVAVPGSIAFEKMSEAEMVSFFKAAEACLARNYGFAGKAAA